MIVAARLLTARHGVTTTGEINRYTTLSRCPMIEVLTAVLVLVTGWYAWLTMRILKANERAVQATLDQNMALTRPYVVVALSVSNHAVYKLIVRNTGRTAANDLRLSIDESFYEHGKEGRNLADAHLFSQGIASLAPGAEIHYLLAHGSQLFRSESDPADKGMPLQFTVTATYSFADRTVEEAIPVDLEQYRGTVLQATQTEKELEKLRKATESLLAEYKKAQRS